jgi:hypothetical protein
MCTPRSLSDGCSFFWYRLKMSNPSESEIMPATVLVDVQLRRTGADEHDASLQELGQLIETLGWKIAGTLTSWRSATSSGRRRVHASTKNAFSASPGN